MGGINCYHTQHTALILRLQITTCSDPWPVFRERNFESIEALKLGHTEREGEGEEGEEKEEEEEEEERRFSRTEEEEEK